LGLFKGFRYVAHDANWIDKSVVRRSPRMRRALKNIVAELFMSLREKKKSAG